MTGQQIKTLIYAYLEARGWIEEAPGKYLAWRDPDADSIIALYCWHAAFVVECEREKASPSLHVVERSGDRV